MAPLRRQLRGLIFWLDRYHWLWLGLAAVFLLFPTPRTSPVMLVVPGLWLLHWLAASQPTSSSIKGALRTHPSPVPFTPLNGTILLLAVMVLVSLWATYDINQSLPKISGMVLAFGVFFACIRTATLWVGWLSTFGVFLMSGLGVAVLGLLGTSWTTTKFGFLNPFLARLPSLIAGLPGAAAGLHPNEVGGALTWVLPPFLALSVYLVFPRSGPGLQRLWVRDAGKPLANWILWILRIAVWLAAVLVGIVFLLTQSRSSYLGIGCAVVLLIWWLLPPRLRWVAVLLVLATGFGLWFGLPEEFHWRVRAWIYSSGVTAAGAVSLNSLSGRLELWSRAIFGLSDFPFTGMGMNTFREVVHVLYPLFTTQTDIDIGHAHNEFLQAGLDLGLPGMIAFISLNVLVFAMLLDLWKQIHFLKPQIRGFLAACILGLAAGLTAHLIYGITDAVALGAKPGVLFWMLLALITALYIQIKSAQMQEGGSSVWAGREENTHP